jgi:hypothetical protein
MTQQWVPAYQSARAPAAPPTQLDAGALRFCQAIRTLGYLIL